MHHDGRKATVNEGDEGRVLDPRRHRIPDSHEVNGHISLCRLDVDPDRVLRVAKRMTEVIVRYTLSQG